MNRAQTLQVKLKDSGANPVLRVLRNWALLLAPLLLAGCVSHGLVTMATCGLYTTVLPAGFETLDQPVHLADRQTSFAAGEIPVIVVSGYDRATVTLDLTGPAADQPLISREVYIPPGKVLAQPLNLTAAGTYAVVLQMGGRVMEHCQFHVNRPPVPARPLIASTGSNGILTLEGANADALADASSSVFYNQIRLLDREDNPDNPWPKPAPEPTLRDVGGKTRIYP